MEIDNVPILGKINKTLNRIIANLIILGTVSIILAVLILLFPNALDVLAAAFLLVSAAVFFHISYSVCSYKRKYMKYFKK